MLTQSSARPSFESRRLNDIGLCAADDTTGLIHVMEGKSKATKHLTLNEAMNAGLIGTERLKNKMVPGVEVALRPN